MRMFQGFVVRCWCYCILILSKFCLSARVRALSQDSDTSLCLFSIFQSCFHHPRTFVSLQLSPTRQTLYSKDFFLTSPSFATFASNFGISDIPGERQLDILLLTRLPNNVGLAWLCFLKLLSSFLWIWSFSPLKALLFLPCHSIPNSAVCNFSQFIMPCLSLPVVSHPLFTQVRA